jgi:hypothetical protein
MGRSSIEGRPFFFTTTYCMRLAAPVNEFLPDSYRVEIQAGWLPMGRKPNENPPIPLEIGLAPPTFAALQQLVKIGYGQNPTEVARYLIQREVDDLRRSRVIPPPDAANSPSTDAKPGDAPLR